MRYYLTLFFVLLISSVSAEDKTTLYDFRYWTAPDHTRIVIDTEEDTLFSLSKDNNYIILSVDDAEVLSETFSNIFFEDKRIKKTRINVTEKLLNSSFTPTEITLSNISHCLQMQNTDITA